MSAELDTPTYRFNLSTYPLPPLLMPGFFGILRTSLTSVLAIWMVMPIVIFILFTVTPGTSVGNAAGLCIILEVVGFFRFKPSCDAIFVGRWLKSGGVNRRIILAVLGGTPHEVVGCDLVRDQYRLAVKINDAIWRFDVPVDVPRQESVEPWIWLYDVHDDLEISRLVRRMTNFGQPKWIPTSLTFYVTTKKVVLGSVEKLMTL